MAGDRPQRSWTRHILVILCWAYLLTVAAAWLFLRNEGDRWWPATLLMACPRWPLLIPAGIILPATIWQRRWGLVMVLLGTTGLVLGPLMGMRFSIPAGTNERGDIRLLTCNIHRHHVNVDQLGAFIRSTNPNVVLLQDCSSSEEDQLFAAGEWQLRRDGQLFIASRFPIARVTPVDLRTAMGGSISERSAAICYDVETPAGRIRLINLHLASPHTGLLTFSRDFGRELEANAERRWQESAAVRAVAETSTDPVLIAGDFNTTDDSPIFREHWSDFADAFSDRGLGIGYTYLNSHTQLRIDHILAGPAWQTVRCWVGPAVGSPHRPLVADLHVR